MQDRLSRTRMLIGNDAVDILGKAHVAVFGVGGVGGYVVEILARSGVGAIDIIDNDCVCVTNINRQIIATTTTIGRRKVEVAKKRILDINPECRVTALNMFYTPENADAIDMSTYDYVVDCIDTVASKIEIAKRCRDNGVPMIACMGAANKMDATAFRVTDISKTKMDPLAKAMRKKLREEGINHLKVIYSEEPPLKTFTGDDNGCMYADRCGDSRTCAEPRRRTVPASNAFVPAAEGIIAGGEVVKDLIKTMLTATHHNVKTTGGDTAGEQ